MLYSHGKMQGSGIECFTYTYHLFTKRRTCSVDYAYTADMMAKDRQSAKHIQFRIYASQQSRNSSIQCTPKSSCHIQSHRLKATRQVAPIKAEMLMAAKVVAPLVGAGVGVGDESDSTSARQSTELSL